MYNVKASKPPIRTRHSERLHDPATDRRHHSTARSLFRGTRARIDASIARVRPRVRAKLFHRVRLSRSRVLARVASPRVVAINGGDGTVQAALTELYSGGHFEGIAWKVR